jgi:hypothetical protein
MRLAGAVEGGERREHDGRNDKGADFRARRLARAEAGRAPAPRPDPQRRKISSLAARRRARQRGSPTGRRPERPAAAGNRVRSRIGMIERGRLWRRRGGRPSRPRATNGQRGGGAGGGPDRRAAIERCPCADFSLEGGDAHRGGHGSRSRVMAGPAPAAKRLIPERVRGHKSRGTSIPGNLQRRWAPCCPSPRARTGTAPLGSIRPREYNPHAPRSSARVQCRGPQARAPEISRRSD